MKAKQVMSKMGLKGVFTLEVFDKKGKLISKEEVKNIMTDEGLNAVLNILLHNATQINPWYCVVFESDTTPTGAETYAVPVYTECQAYTEGTRPEYVEAESVAKSTTNSASKAVFTMNASKDLYGAALVGNGSAPDTKGNTAGGGTLLCCGRFAVMQPVISGNIVNLTYTITAADAG